MADAPPPVEALLVERRGGIVAAGLLRGGRLDDLILQPVSGPLVPGAIVAGRVIRVEPGMGAAFLDIGGAQPALLRARDLPREDPARPIERRIHEGQLLAVRVVHPGYDGKGARVIARIGANLPASPAGAVPGAVLHAPDPLAEIARAIGSTEPPEVVVADTLARLQVRQVWAAAGRREPAVTIDPDGRPLGRCDAIGAIAAALESEVALPGGGRVSFEQTRALSAVDVDSGTATRDPASANLAAAGEIARQMRIRNSAGVIIIDFIDAARADRQPAIETAMRTATAADRAGVRHAGFGPLGLYELVRNRHGAPLAALWPAATGAG